MKTEISLRNNRNVELVSIDQWRTYEGLLAGVPHAATNNFIVEHTIKKAKKRYFQDPYLIQPIIEKIILDQPYSFGDPESMPKITCVAKFNSHKIARNNSMDASELVIIWFQSEFAFPINEKIIKEIQNINWEAQANDYEYG